MNLFTKRVFIILQTFISVTPTSAQNQKPNILWIVSEDNSTYLGCYGDKKANTIHLNSLAKKGIYYTNCFANAPVCAPARSTWLLGIPASSAGTHHMRSTYAVPKSLIPYPTLISKAGYYTSNNNKTDYNTSSYDGEIWHESSGKAHYLNRPDKNQPFFSVFNFKESHESKIFPSGKNKKENISTPLLNVHPNPLNIPPYQIENTETRSDWVKLYQKIEEMDKQIGKLLLELERSGEADNTIIFYCSDHAGIMIRSKRFLFDSGTRVPFIAYFPEKWKHLAPKDYQPGHTSTRLVDFTDMTKTFLSLTGAEIPEHYSGRAFCGTQSEPAQKKIFLFSGRFDEAPDMSRALTDGRYKYLRNYEPDRNFHQLVGYPLRQTAQMAHFIAFKAGKTNSIQSSIFQAQPPEAFFDTQNDPHEIDNLIESSDHQNLITQFRQELDDTILRSRDLGFIPEPLMASINEKESLFEWGQSDENYPLKEIIQLANLASSQNSEYIKVFKKYLEHKNPILRYWSALGLRALKEKTIEIKPILQKALEDSNPSVRITAACALGKLGQKSAMAEFLINEIREATLDAHANWALNGLKYIGHTQLPRNHKKSDFSKGKYSDRSYTDLLVGKTYLDLRTPTK